MSKKFKPTYTIDLTGVETLEELDLATIVGKLNASDLTDDDLATLMTIKMKYVIADNDADGILIYPDGACDLVRVDEMLEKGSTMLHDLIGHLENAAVTVNEVTEKKQPWYKRLWNKIFGKKK